VNKFKITSNLKKKITVFFFTTQQTINGKMLRKSRHCGGGCVGREGTLVIDETRQKRLKFLKSGHTTLCLFSNRVID